MFMCTHIRCRNPSRRGAAQVAEAGQRRGPPPRGRHGAAQRIALQLQHLQRAPAARGAPLRGQRPRQRVALQVRLPQRLRAPPRSAAPRLPRPLAALAAARPPGPCQRIVRIVPHVPPAAHALLQGLMQISPWWPGARPPGWGPSPCACAAGRSGARRQRARTAKPAPHSGGSVPLRRLPCRPSTVRRGSARGSWPHSTGSEPVSALRPRCSAASRVMEPGVAQDAGTEPAGGGARLTRRPRLPCRVHAAAAVRRPAPAARPASRAHHRQRRAAGKRAGKAGPAAARPSHLLSPE
jgi:hypothetical protein